MPELKGLTLVLNFDTIAAIYLNTLTMWNDARIKAINSPEVAAALPAQPITVITSSDSSAPEQLFTYMLSAEVPEFNATVTTQLFACARRESLTLILDRRWAWAPT